jgi:hypothetical protein
MIHINLSFGTDDELTFVLVVFYMKKNRKSLISEPLYDYDTDSKQRGFSELFLSCSFPLPIE